MSSTRLPGKVLADVNGVPMILRQLDRVRRAKSIHHIVVATSTHDSDNQLADYVRSQGFDVHRGSLEDVYLRYCSTLERFSADHFVRLTADCPLADWEVIDTVVGEHLKSGATYTSNTLLRTFPQGLDVEVANVDDFLSLREASLSEFEREHVMPAFYNNTRGFLTKNVVQEVDQSTYRWTVDTQGDLDFVRGVYSTFDPATDFTTDDIFNSIPDSEQRKN